MCNSCMFNQVVLFQLIQNWYVLLFGGKGVLENVKMKV